MSFRQFIFILLLVGHLFILILANGNHEPTISLTDGDKLRLRKIIELKTPLSANTLANIYYNINLKFHLDKSVSESQKICDHIKKDSGETIESIYYQTSIAKLLTGCQLDTTKLATKLQSLIKNDLTVMDVYRAGLALANMGKPLDSTKFPRLLIEALKREDTLLNTGLAFQLASKFAKPQDQNQFVEKMADVIVQADEVNGKYLQFEGGLGVSSAVIRGVYQLATAVNKSVGITAAQAMKFVNYFLSRKYVLTPKGASEVIETLALFTNNKYHIPYMITKFGSSSLSANDNPVLTLKITNVLGESVGPVTVTGASLSLNKDKNNAIMKNIQFKSVEGDSTLFAYDFFKDKSTLSLASGFYTLTVNVSPQKSDSRILGNTGITIGLSVLTQIKIDDAELTITDADVGTKTFGLIYPTSLDQLIDVDYLQRIQLKFQIKDSQNDKTVRVHQSFVRFYHMDTKQEITFVSELDSTGFHKVDLNLPARSKDFNELSGKYQLDLYIGDPLIIEATSWKIGMINLQFGSSSSSTNGLATTMHRKEYSPKPEIKHIFREQDKRPHAMVSNFFTILALLPLLGLFVAWFKIGINLSDFQFSLSALLFHGSVAAIFLLYVCFFLKLNMFQTIKYLAGLSAIAYLSGHSLLSRLIRSKK
ncbi:dolichyl-diphosphooligosaccharide-protein glycosyltransferase subunit 2-like protein [Dermatophagoides farinae]|uniref:Dolichyl-diphosphooligosaccharide--protein glycosyltransferase subunit 2 n=1 Tax=Dermatophagoides farinae TaxID=6954 RepID=A0A9D4SIU1_DERFA|nr:dolichyl-diphosphooligosaccharide--protein glycosyltransferase subunit 2-like [Dermatophagoides farinae]KAH7643011.1 dolichyl-diphosphooligosaccharide-protein glycosyltransferase subunit 2-like protein [Dermatophagoides farinae]